MRAFDTESNSGKNITGTAIGDDYAIDVDGFRSVDCCRRTRLQRRLHNRIRYRIHGQHGSASITDGACEARGIADSTSS